MTATDVVFQPLASTSVVGVGAFTGLSGYMTLGLGTKPKPSVATVGDGEVLIAKDREFSEFV